MVFAVKHDGQHKARLVAGGNFTSLDPGEDAYSSVVEATSVRLAIFAAQLGYLNCYVRFTAPLGLIPVRSYDIYILFMMELLRTVMTVMIDDSISLGNKGAPKAVHLYSFPYC